MHTTQNIQVDIWTLCYVKATRDVGCRVLMWEKLSAWATRKEPPERSPLNITPGTVPLSAVWHTAKRPHVYLLTLASFRPLGNLLTQMIHLLYKKKINKIKNPKHTSSHCIDKPQKAGGSGYLWHAKAVVLCSTPHRSKHSRVKHVAIPVQKGL